MEQLPFAVDDNDSLLTASSQGSFLPTEEFTKIGHRVTNLFRKHDEEEESVAFYMTDVDDDEVDIWLEPEKEPEDGDGLVRLLTQELAQPHNPLLELCHQANRQSQSAVQARTRGKLPEALQYHTQAAQAFRDAAQLVRDSDASLARSLAVLSQTQAQAAWNLQRIVKLRPTVLASFQKRRLQPSVDIHDSYENDESTVSTDSGKILDSQESSNPVDEMMELERELKDMDLALELGNSIASLDARNRLKSSVSESFMVVGNNMSSSSVILAPRGVQRHRTNKVRVPPRPALEASWWGTSSVAASQVLLTEAVPSHTKQVVKLMENLKTLTDENAVLHRQVEEAEAARVEAKQAREQMRRFKEEYGRNYVKLREAFEKFAKDYPKNNPVTGAVNPLMSSEYMRSSSTVYDQMQKQDDQIRQLMQELHRERETSKKKDAALRKYETFYRAVKERSAEKAQKVAERQRGNAP